MPEKELNNPVLTFWIWNVVFASFFTFVRAFIKQEFKNPWVALATSVISLGTALFCGHMVDSWTGKEWMVRTVIAAGALISYDLLRAFLHFGSKFDGNTFWALFKAYTGQSSLPDKMPSKDEE